MKSLQQDDVLAEFHRRKDALDRRAREITFAVERINRTLPPIRNVALRDTPVSLHDIPHRYDTMFAAHEVPCIIDYQLSVPVDNGLSDIDYIEAYVTQLLAEAQGLADLGLDTCIERLEARCPDYRGLHVNLYEFCCKPFHPTTPTSQAKTV